MKQNTRLRLTSALAVVSGLGATAAVWAADDAGVRDFLMGRYEPPVRDWAAPLTVPVSPRPRSTSPVARAPDPARPNQVAQAGWKSDPNWFLRDNTLRRGDMIVLKDRVISFNGSSSFPFSPEDFTTLRESDVRKQQIGKIAGL